MTTPLTDVSDIEQQTIKRVTKRMIPFLILLFVVAFLDRNNVGFAALRMNEDIGISQTIYGLGAGISSSVTSCSKCRATFCCTATAPGSGSPGSW